MQPYAGSRSTCGPYAAVLWPNVRALDLPHRAALVQPYAAALINRESRHDTAISISAEMTTGEVERQAGDAVGGAGMGSGGGPAEAEEDWRPTRGRDSPNILRSGSP
jgi:hypothetical protein